eukprot:CAMPEP_0202392136 /NCGR_PEP_ID=MMETSP1127-20130417/92210_1 /ASSEMBLY_ACC=CAM_ASM_000462 /TAXON_ID=3047 /ORGANISM="Dunaliella tertiolecta, Strain CCMP1320" /LENGTH=647 /DNA_ID=CAMNT_0048994619 /DNA_START=758 /DNA_END=2704 /DNA_ORIENTATION=-
MALHSKVKPSNEGDRRQKLPVTECGIRVSWLLSWAKVVEQKLGPDATTADVCAKFVIPSTRSKKCRYVDIIEPVNVGAPQYFLSHTWSMRFATLMEVVAQRLRNEPDSFVWLDICAINQNKYEDKGELQADDVSHLSSVVRKAKSTLFCLDEKGKSLTRIWCLFEIWHTVKAKGSAGLEILTYQMRFLPNLFHEIDVSKAQASLESDRVRILAEIAADIGYQQLSLNIKEALVESADREAQQALALAQQHVGPSTGSTPTDSPALAAAAACTKAAFVAHAARQYERAGEYDSRALDLNTKVLGLEHPDTIASMESVGVSLSDQGKLKEAEAVKREVLALQAKVQDPLADFRALNGMRNLAQNLLSQSKYEEAEAMYRQVLVLHAKVDGPEHPAQIHSMINLVHALNGQGKRGEGEAVQRQVLELQTKVLGPDHPDTTRMMDALAVNLIIMHKREEAETLQRQVLQLRTKALGPENPDIIYSMKDLIRNLVGQGKHEEAEAMKRQVLELQVKVLGQEHPDTVYTLQSMRNLAPGMKQQAPRKPAPSKPAPKPALTKPAPTATPAKPAAKPAIGKLSTSVTGQRGTSVTGQRGTSVTRQRGSSVTGQEGTSVTVRKGTSVTGQKGTSITGQKGTYMPISAGPKATTSKK